jgi:competence protein ComEC
LTAASLAVFLAVTVISPVAEQLRTPRDWVVLACDVGQGDAILVRNPRAPEHAMLIDTGDDPELLTECLTVFGVDRISLLVLSHDDRDHTGALSAIVDLVDSALIAPTVIGEALAQREVVRTLEQAKIDYRVGAAGNSGALPDGGPTWQVLAPEPWSTPSDSNAASLVMTVDVDGMTALLLADTGNEQQSALLRQSLLPDIDLLKVAHHGSRDQDQSLPATVQAKWALVSVGAGNGYGHPAAETLAALAHAGTATLRTDLQGSVAIRLTSEGALVPWVERER